MPSDLEQLSIFYLSFFFFFHDTATTEIYTLSLHDALPIWSSPTPPPPTSRRSTSSAPARTRSARPLTARRRRLAWCGPSTAILGPPDPPGQRRSGRLVSRLTQLAIHMPRRMTCGATPRRPSIPRGV